GIASAPNNIEFFSVDNAVEELLVFCVGEGAFQARATWDSLGDISQGDFTPLSISTQELAQRTLETIDKAIIHKDKIRASLGAMQNRMENTITNLTIQSENLQMSESRISDADIASEMTEFVRHQIVSQGAVSMLAQANSLPRMALQLMQG
ncbi:MAG: flagellin, partial [Desulfonatronovibrio sp. MSAO_Bac4]